MRLKIIVTPFIIFCFTTLCFTQQKAQSQEAQVKLLQQKIDSLNQQMNTNKSTINKKLDDIDSKISDSLSRTAQHKIDIANVLIQWMAALLAITTIIIAIAGFIGLREFNAVRLKEREMENKLDQMSEALEKISEVRQQALTESKNLTLCLHYLSEANALKNNGQIQESQKQLIKALEMTKETDYDLRSELHLLLGDNYRMQTDYTKAISEIRKSIELKSDNPNTHRVLGNVYFMMNRLDEAEVSLKKSLEVSPDNPRTLNNLGEIYVRKKEFEDAEKTFLYCLELDSEFSAPCLHLGTIYRFWDQIEKSISYFEKAERLCKSRIDIGSTHVHDYYTLGWANIGKGVVDEAKHYMEEAYRSFPSKDVVREVLWYIEVLAASPNPPSGINEITELLNKKLIS